MKITKTCAYRTNYYNLLPTILITPLYSVVVGWPVFTANQAALADQVAYGGPKPHWQRAGFLLSFKFACFHAGIEVHYNES